MIQIKRVYEAPDSCDGRRFLVERLWPRGMRKSDLLMEGWLKDLAPSTALRQWFGHDLAKWEEFQQRYVAELEKNPAALAPLLDAARQGNLTLLYSAHDQEHNSALVLKNFLTTHTKQERSLKLEDLPNIGKSIAADLRAIGILYPHQLTEREPLAIYNELSRAMGHRHDPCVLYTLLAAQHFLEHGDALPWWKFTEQGRKLLNKDSRR